ncbi:dienelactone hydrolase family protein [Egicoccus halophilus]|uniref:Dienelactone hydrolase n=1 Tax=Egicoccus halophilus TaxID=1670830 RepID=A0A8J3AAT9_9ACTN|nr:dienelactone hydrolase family protein [Egicoccus halophilus]GGI09481.1 dienelactone hydrolase [Egicoccus halophilus]
MVDVVVFHSALGRRPAIEAFAQVLREDGHTVAVPDLYAGATFTDVHEGVAERDRIEFTTLLARAEAGVLNLAPELVYVGFSMGAAPAMLLGGNRPGTRGIVSVQAAITPIDLGLSRWPAGVPLQLHHAPGDPWQPDDEVAALRDAVPDELVEYHEYPGTGHLFMDPDLDVHDAPATERFTAAVRAWLAER